MGFRSPMYPRCDVAIYVFIYLIEHLLNDNSSQPKMSRRMQNEEGMFSTFQMYSTCHVVILLLHVLERESEYT